MKNKVLLVLGFLFIASANSAVETSIGAVKAVKISQKVEISDCQANFVQKTYSSFCKVPVFSKKDTDMVLSISEPATLKVNQGNGVYLKANLTANVEGFYWFIFEKRTEGGDYLSAPSFDQVSFVMNDLIQQLENGELSWKLYRVQ